jgi:hypothetical protein
MRGIKVNIPGLSLKKGKYKILLANDKAIYSNTLEYSDRGIYVGRTSIQYMFIPYDAILWVEYNEDHTK